MTRARRQRRFARSIRARATIAAALVSGAALAGAGAGLVVSVHDSLSSAVASAVNSEMASILTATGASSPPGRLPGGQGGIMAQVVGANGQVLMATGNVDGQAPLLTRRQVSESVGRRIIVNSVSGADPGPYMALGARPARRGREAVYVVASMAGVASSTRTVLAGVAVGIPLLTAVVAGLTWILVGRALRPVEEVRSEVAEISQRALHRRIPTPGTGDEVARLADTMNAMLDRLEASARDQRQFVADSSHELRSPLAAILNEIEVAQAHPTATTREQVLDGLHLEAKRLELVVDELLVLAKADAGRLLVSWGLVDLDEVVAAETQRLKKRANLTVDVTGVLATQVRGDRDSLGRLVWNLLDNARRHARSAVQVEVSESDGWAELAVTDDGRGIPEPDRKRVFERFTRLDEARSRDSGGCGLGLAIVLEIAVAHKGTVEVADAPGGARLVVRLPLAAS